MALSKELSPDVWRLTVQDNQAYRLRTINAAGDYIVKGSMDKVLAAADMLSPEAITAVLDGSMDKNKCTCPTGVGAQRCQHKFTYEQVRSARAKWVFGGEDYLVQKLKKILSTILGQIVSGNGGSRTQLKTLKYVVDFL